jgi:hypothetical protein
MQRRNSLLIGAATALLTFGTLGSILGFRHPMRHGYGHHPHTVCHSEMKAGCENQQETIQQQNGNK